MENDATQTSEVSKYQLISQPKLDKFQLQCYCKLMFEVTATRFHAATKTFVPLIKSVVDDTLLQTGVAYNKYSPEFVLPSTYYIYI